MEAGIRSFRQVRETAPLQFPFMSPAAFPGLIPVKNFFLDHYDHPIYEAGVLLKDMVYFQMDLSGKKQAE